MKSIVFLHIGTAKTGTTAIQIFLRRNKNALEKKGCMFPVWDRKFEGVRTERNGHFLSPSVDGDYREMCFSAIEHFSEKYSKIILTSEGLWNRGGERQEFWADLKQRFNSSNIELKVVVYLRRQDAYISSFWAQHVKGLEMYSKTFAEYMHKECDRRNHLDYYAYLSNVAQIIGKENVIVRPYEFSQFSGKDKTIVSDFLEAIEIEYDETLQFENEQQNTSMRGIMLEVKRWLNSVPEFRKKRSTCKALFESVQSDMRESALLNKGCTFIRNERKKFLKRYEQGNDAVAREFLGRKKLFLDATLPKDRAYCKYTYKELEKVYERLVLRHKELLENGTMRVFEQHEFEMICSKALKKIKKERNLCLRVRRMVKKCFSNKGRKENKRYA